MLTWLAGAVLVIVVTSAVVAKLLARTRAPDPGSFLDHPYADWAGSIQPDEMRVTLNLIDDGHETPCDRHGKPT